MFLWFQGNSLTQPGQLFNFRSLKDLFSVLDQKEVQMPSTKAIKTSSTWMSGNLHKHVWLQKVKKLVLSGQHFQFSGPRCPASRQVESLPLCIPSIVPHISNTLDGATTCQCTSTSGEISYPSWRVIYCIPTLIDYVYRSGLWSYSSSLVQVHYECTSTIQVAFVL